MPNPGAEPGLDGPRGTNLASTDTADHPEPSRRDFLYIATGAVAGVGAVMMVWPLIDQMNPDAAALALATIEVDISAIEPGMSVTVKWRGKPVFIRNRTEEEIAEAQAVPLSDLIDRNARNPNLPADAPRRPTRTVRPPGWRAFSFRSAYAPISAACRLASRGPLAGGSVRATAPPMTPPVAYALDRRRRTCTSQSTSSFQTPRSGSAERGKGRSWRQPPAISPRGVSANGLKPGCRSWASSTGPLWPIRRRAT